MPANRWGAPLLLATVTQRPSAHLPKASGPVAERNGSGFSAFVFPWSVEPILVMIPSSNVRPPRSRVTSSPCNSQLSAQWLQECCFYG